MGAFPIVPMTPQHSESRRTSRHSFALVKDGDTFGAMPNGARSKPGPAGLNAESRWRAVSQDYATHVIAECPMLRHRHTMSEQDNEFEQAAQIVEAFSESETDERILELLARIAAAIRDQAIDN
jgi:hypothetical protein